MPHTWSSRPLYEIKAGLFRGLSHPYRIRILELLADGQEHTVSELIEGTELEASHVSQHLSVLRRNRLVASERRSSFVHYRLTSPRVADLLAVARALLGEMAADDSRLVDGFADLPEIPAHDR